MNTLKGTNIKMLKQIERVMPNERFMSKCIHFLINMYHCSKDIKENQMIKYRITKLLEQVLLTIDSLGEIEGGKNEKVKVGYLISKCDMIFYTLTKKKIISNQDKYTLEQVSQPL